MTMKGAETRLSLLGALLTPKDRLQLAQELGLDWKAIDYHINLFNRYGLVYEQQVSGRVKMYKLTSLGEMLLGLLRDLNAEIGRNPAMDSVATEPARKVA
jgi:predicted transcriptional regulator